jgi:hypothetical protein
LTPCLMQILLDSRLACIFLLNTTLTATNEKPLQPRLMFNHQAA